MITVYCMTPEGAITANVLQPGDAMPAHFVWIDLLNPTPEEEQLVAATGIKIPSHEQIWKNDTLNRFYEEDGLHYMTAALITKIDTVHPGTSAITFVTSRDYMMTLRYISPTSFKNFGDRLIKNPKKFSSGTHVIEGLLEEIITRVAHNSEKVVMELDGLSHVVFGRTEEGEETKRPMTTSDMKHMLKDLGNAADLNSKINESLHSISRLVTYLPQLPGAKTLEKNIRTLENDTKALLRQTAFLSDKITFLLDATLGMINAEQNVIVKTFSMVTMFFLPPTLLASFYGMNFAYMPQLDNPLGYPSVLVAMGVFALIPYLVFRKKGWF